MPWTEDLSVFLGMDAKPVTAGAISGKGYLDQNVEVIFDGAVAVIDYVLTAPTAILGSLGYGQSVTVAGLNYKTLRQLNNDGDFCRLELIPGVGTTPPPTGAAYLVRIAVAGNMVYTGRAPSGTAESAVGWTIKRRTFNAAGVLQATATASGAWSNYASLTYS